MQHGWVGYAQDDLVLPLDDVIQDKEDYIPAALDYVTWDGKLWGIPYRIETHGVIYNRATSRPPGSIRTSRRRPGTSWSPPPRSSRSASQSGFAITGGGEVGNTIFRSLPFIWMNGGGIISDDIKTATVNSRRRSRR